jgi:predicted small secreted protein
MKRFAWLFLAVLCSAVLVNAEDNTMSGWVCDSKCVVQNDNRATCDPTCAERSGDDVFVSDEGAVSAISNPEVCTSHMNKHVTATYSREEPAADQKDINKARQDRIQIQELRDAGGIGG